VEREWEPGEFDYEMESIGSCECCYGEFCRQGTLIMFWEPHRVIETVKDPYCSPTASESSLLEDSSTEDEEITAETDIMEELQLGGTHSAHSNTEDATVFAQVHYLTHPDLDEIIRDFDTECWEFSDTGREYISEDDDDWQAIYSSDWWPEAEMFANLEMVEVCIADALTAQFGTPIDALYWCMGTWGMLFNMNGHLNQDEYTTGNAGLAARTIAHMGRRMMLWDAATVICYAGPMPIWFKSYFKLQPLRPTERDFKIPIGQAPEFWGEDLNKLEGGDNFAWLLWRKRICCSSEQSSGSGGSGGNQGGSGGSGSGGMP
jgi:conjugal transfer pilus assembly protein TraU